MAGGEKSERPEGPMLDALRADLDTLAAVSADPSRRPLATSKQTIAKRMVSDAGYPKSEKGVLARLSGNGVPVRLYERRAFFEAMHVTMAAEFEAAGLPMVHDYRAFTSRYIVEGADQVPQTDVVVDADAVPVPSPARPLAKPGRSALTILFAGAHPDDVELGAGALIQRCIERGWQVHILVLTDEGRVKEERRSEAVAAATALGVPPKHVHFAGFRDGKLRDTKARVTEVQDLLRKAKVDPAVIVTHTVHDLHNDHRAASGLMRSAFRHKVILGFSVHTSSEGSQFDPRLFISIEEERGRRKDYALSFHRSQAGRLAKGGSRQDFEEGLGALGGLDRAEGFAIDFQKEDPASVREVLELSDSPFHAFWSPLISDGGRVYLLHEAYINQPKSIALHSRGDELRGRHLLSDAFNDMWVPRSPMRELHSSLDDEALDAFRNEHIVLAGGAVSNPLTATFFNRLSTIDYVIECDQPGSEPVYLLRRSTGEKWMPDKVNDDLVRDVAVLSILPNPFAFPGKVLVAVAGVHGRGSEGLLRFLADPGSSPEVLKLVLELGWCNVPVHVEHSDLSVSVMPGYEPKPLDL